MDNSIREYVENRIANEGFLTSKRRKKNGPIKKALISLSMVSVALTTVLFGCGKKKNTEPKDTKPVVHEIETTTKRSKEEIKETTTNANIKKTSNNTKKTTTTSNSTNKKTTTSGSTSNKSTTTKTTTTSSTKKNTESTTKSETKESGNTIIVNLEEPSGQIVYNEETSKPTNVIEEESNTVSDSNYIYSDVDFYDANWNIVIAKGTLMLKETYESAKKELNYNGVVNVTNANDENVEENITEEPIVETTDEEEIIEEEIIEEYEEYYDGVLNDDLTYTVNGITYESKEVYEYFLLYPDQFYMGPDGIVRPISNIESNEYQKTLK